MLRDGLRQLTSSRHSSSVVSKVLSLARAVLSSTSLILEVNLLDSHQTAITIANMSMNSRVRNWESHSLSIESPSRRNKVDVARTLWFDAASQSAS